MIAADSEQITFATARQKSKIAQLCMALDLQERLEEKVITSKEASDFTKELCVCLKVNRDEGRLGSRRRLVYSQNIWPNY